MKSNYIFCYGSLMWDNSISFEQKQFAKIKGYKRSFNKKSTKHWGTEQNPAPVLGLEKEGICKGIIFEISPEKIDEEIKKLKKREGTSYKLEKTKAKLPDREVKTYIFVNKKNKSYIGNLSLDKRAKMASKAKGEKGTAKEYIKITHRKLKESKIKDENVNKFFKKVQ